MFVITNPVRLSEGKLNDRLKAVVKHLPERKEFQEKTKKDNKINKYFKEITNIKKPASIYIDDRALKFDGNFNKTFEEIENFTVHWKK